MDGSVYPKFPEGKQGVLIEMEGYITEANKKRSGLLRVNVPALKEKEKGNLFEKKWISARKAK